MLFHNHGVAPNAHIYLTTNQACRKGFNNNLQGIYTGFSFKQKTARN